MAGDVTIFYLEMHTQSELKAKTCENSSISILKCTTKQWKYNKFLYQFVGDAWQWFDKLECSDEEWQNYVEQKGLHTYVMYDNASIAGYFELLQTDAYVDIAYFGLSREYIGKGIGGFMLSEAIKAAWKLETPKLSVNTCTLDHPSALKNYEARGFKIVKTKVVQKEYA